MGPDRFSWMFACALSLAPAWAACGLEAATDDQKNASFRVVAEEQEGALFSVSGTAENDVWVVGAAKANRRPTVVHWDGKGWESRDVPSEGDLFWVHAFDEDDVWAAGSNGLVVHYDGVGFEVASTPADGVVWGLWGDTPADLWAVGSDAAATRGFVWRNRQDQGWRVVDLPGSAPKPSAWFKVWGAAGDDVWFCGAEGALMHFDGADFAKVDSGTARSLLTVHGSEDGSVVTAVGGQFSATLVVSEQGEPFHDVTPEEDVPQQTFGVFHRGSDAYAVGMQMLVLHRDDSGWSRVAHDLIGYGDLHGVWIDPAGGVWAAGGQVVLPPYGDGVLVYQGPTPPSSFSR